MFNSTHATYCNHVSVYIIFLLIVNVALYIYTATYVVEEIIPCRIRLVQLVNSCTCDCGVNFLS